MISKHNNGTLNLWDVMFADKSKFTSLLNISHKSRASGHRFRFEHYNYILVLHYIWYSLKELDLLDSVSIRSRMLKEFFFVIFKFCNEEQGCFKRFFLTFSAHFSMSKKTREVLEGFFCQFLAHFSIL